MTGILVTATLMAQLVPSAASAETPLPDYVAAALADPDRPAADKDRDSARKPAELIACAGIKPGDAVLEVLPGDGYFTRIFSRVVGPDGHLFAAVADSKSTDAEPAASAIASDVEYSNIMVISHTPEAMKPLPPLDVIWTSQNYHDLHSSRVHADVAALDKTWFEILKPGGIVVLIDHVALPGSPVAQTADSLQRIDPAIARREMEAAGFKFDGECDALRNSADMHLVTAFDPSIRGRTDQFVYRFRKPM